ncbi:colicin E3/pyocin S6 family cytotoxin [Enterococcus sp. DIV0724b]|uniref:colicin E3/pyocin S6 family cytotoxin n=1 Tax=Enterococcus sp. DIV0724b TaxID=2774694 RepID=UPI003D2FB161
MKGAKVFEKDGKYYHRDTLHKGKGSHLEVYDKHGKHIGEADPKTGELKPGTADLNKKLPK